MSVLLWIIASYIVLDRLCVLALVGKTVQYTPGVVVLTWITGGLIVWVLLTAATGGVTP